MKIRIETVSGYDSGLGHTTRMNILAIELRSKYNAEVNIYTELGGEVGEQLAIIDIDTYSETMNRIYNIRKSTPNPHIPIIVFKNGVDEEWAKIHMSTEYIIVPSFVNIILDACFRKGRNKYDKFRDDIKIIFLNQGGSDPWGLAPRILHILDLLFVRSLIYVIVGKATHDLTMQQILSFQKSTRLNMIVEYNIEPVEMCQMMKWSDLAITAPGQTFAELTAMSVPSIIIGHHKRHGSLSREIAYRKAAIDLGVGTTMKDEELVRGLSRALNIMEPLKQRMEYVKKASKLVDVNGIDRVTKYIEGVL